MQSGIYLPSLTRTNKIIIICLAAAFLLTSALSQGLGLNISYFLALSPATFFSGLVYQLATYVFIAQGPIELLFNCLLFWFIGADLEKMWGTRRYLGFLATSALGGGALYLLISGPFLGGMPLFLSGAAGVTSSLLVAFAILNPNQVFSFMLLFPMKAKYFCMLLIALQLYMGVFSPAGVLAWGHLGTILSGYLYMLYLARFSGKKSPKSRAKLRVVSSEDENPPKYWH